MRERFLRFAESSYFSGTDNLECKMIKNKCILLTLFVFFILSCQKGNSNKIEQGRHIKGQVLISKKLPQIKITLDESFTYQGKFAFKIRDIAKGERYIFVDSDNYKIKRMFIAQFEEFLPANDEFYRYSFQDAMKIRNHKFKQNTYAYSNSESIAVNPEGESALTFKFLSDKGFTVEDELMMSRFVTVAGEDRKHELILFYVENVSESGHKLIEFYEDDNKTQVWQNISKYLTERSLQNFEIIE